MHSRRLLLSRAMALAVGLGVIFSAPVGWSQSDEATFEYKDPVKCGPDGTLTFKAGAKLRIYDSAVGNFDFTGEAQESSRRDETYVIAMTFRDRSGHLLFHLVSDPFRMERGRSTKFTVRGSNRQITKWFPDVQSVDLDCHVPFEKLYEDSFDYFRYVLHYHRTQHLKAHAFDVH